MNVDVYYTGNGGSKRFLIVPAGTDVPGMEFPEDDPDLNRHDLNLLKAFVLDVGAYLFGMTPDDVRDQIHVKGYAVCDLPGQLD